VNTRPHTIRKSRILCKSKSIRIALHLSYSPDLVPSDFFLFDYVKHCLNRASFSSGEEPLLEIGNISREILLDTLLVAFHNWMERYDFIVAYEGHYIHETKFLLIWFSEILFRNRDATFSLDTLYLGERLQLLFIIEAIFQSIVENSENARIFTLSHIFIIKLICEWNIPECTKLTSFSVPMNVAAHRIRPTSWVNVNCPTLSHIISLGSGKSIHRIHQQLFSRMLLEFCKGNPRYHGGMVR
jgi:hypothetical protein